MNDTKHLLAYAMLMLSMSTSAQNSGPYNEVLPAVEEEVDFSPRWGVQASVGESYLTDDESLSNDDRGQGVAITGEYFATRRLAITGGIAWERIGMFSDLDVNYSGAKKYNMLGINLGTKFYFFPKKWIFQPYIGGEAQTNVLNLGHHRGKFNYRSSSYGDQPVTVNYDIKCPPLSLSPKIGADLRVFSSLSLCFSYEYRWAFGGHAVTKAQMTEGTIAGKVFTHDENFNRSMFTLGVKVNFPIRPFDGNKLGSTLLDLIYLWINR